MDTYHDMLVEALMRHNIKARHLPPAIKYPLLAAHWQRQPCQYEAIVEMPLMHCLIDALQEYWGKHGTDDAKAAAQYIVAALSAGVADYLMPELQHDMDEIVTCTECGCRTGLDMACDCAGNIR